MGSVGISFTTEYKPQGLSELDDFRKSWEAQQNIKFVSKEEFKPFKKGK